MRQLLVSVLCLGTLGCDILGPGSVHRELEVAAYKVGCVGLDPTLCLLVREPGDPSWQALYEHPVGFEFQWGVHQVIEVREEERDDVPADASSIVRRLERVVSRSPVAAGTTFAVAVPSDRLSRTGDSTLGIAGEPIDVVCLDAGDCVRVLDAAVSAPRVLLTLRFRSGPGEPLELIRWRACEEPGGPCPP